jgi:putative ABC transport system permease protein
VTRVALKGLAGRKLRAALTALAIVLGVAMISGTYVLTDTIKAGFNGIFTTVYRNVDAVVTGKSAIGGDNNGGVEVPSLPESLLARVRALPETAAADGGIGDTAQLVGRNGKVVTTHGAPTLAFGIDPHGDPQLDPIKILQGRYPQGPGEIAIDRKTATKEHVRVGDTIGVVARGPVVPFHVVGVAALGSSSLGGATLAVFDIRTAQKLFDKQGQLDSIFAAAKPDATPQKLVDAIRPLLPSTAEVRTGQQQATKDSSDTSAFTSFLQYFLLAFGGIALFVGIFVIANTLSITVAQRAREFGTLRTIGATRRQVLGSVILEGGTIGALASVTGLFLGLGLAKALNALFVSFGIDLPKAGTVFATRTVIVSLVVGTLVTLVASLFPALRATRVQPIAAIREGVLPPSRLARFGLPIALAIASAALALLLFGALDSGARTRDRLIAIGLGVVLAFIGVALVAPRFVPPLAQVLGAPGASVGGASGQLARENAMRNPARTASTAAALMIGLALVTVVAVIASGLKTTFESSVNALFRADYALTSQNGFTPTGSAAENALRRVPGVEVVSGVRAGQARVFGKRVGVTGVAGDVTKVIDVKWEHGSPQVPAQLGANGAFVDKDYAKDHHLSIGSSLAVELPSGETLHVVVKGIFAPPKGGSPFGRVTISQKLFDRSFQNPQDVFAFVNVRGGVAPATTHALEAALRNFPDAKIQTESQFKKNQERGINILLNLLFVLLSLSIVISLFGIVNTLVLTVFERTRELGMLRAVGMTRRQVRRMVYWESVTTALIGAALGIPLGIGLAALVGHAIKYPAFTVPWGTIVIFVVAAIIVGLLAAIFPARRAARLNVLQALQYE